MLEVIPIELITTIINFVDYESYMKLFGMNKNFYKILTTNVVRYKEINSNKCKKHHIMFCSNTLEKIILTEDDSITDSALQNLPLIKYLILRVSKMKAVHFVSIENCIKRFIYRSDLEKNNSIIVFLLTKIL